MHPILDLLSTSSLADLSQLGNAYKAMAFTMMWELALKLFKDNQTGCMYYIASPRAQQFFSRMGIRSIQCEGVLPSTTHEAQMLRREWWQYFKPAESPQISRAFIIVQLSHNRNGIRFTLKGSPSWKRAVHRDLNVYDKQMNELVEGKEQFLRDTSSRSLSRKAL